jgi:tight adherence protein B
LGGSVVLALLAFLLGAVPPIAVLGIKVGRRQQAFDEQLSDLLMTMAGSLRAGHTFRQAMQAIVDEGEEPGSKEFKRVLLEIDIGRPVDEALSDMAARIGSRNFEYVISVVSVQREVGGSLGGLLDMVSETVRQRQQFAKKVNALTSMSRTSAYILGAMPFFMAAVLTLLKPGYLTPLFTTSTGHVLILIALGGIALGALVLKKIISFRMA